MFAEERRSRILDLLEEHGSLETNFLVKELHTSRETIRRDLNELAAKDLLNKTHGGAIVKEAARVWHGVPLTIRESKNTDLKKSIGAFAATKVTESDTIFIDNSTTALMMAAYLPRQSKLTIITNSLRFLQEMVKFHETAWTLVFLGGIFFNRTLSTNGYLSTSNLSNFIITKSFMSCYGIGNNLVVSDSHLEDMEMKQVVQKTSQETYLLADHSKFGRFGNLSLGLATQFHGIITDGNADNAVLEQYREKGCFIETASR